MTAKIKLNAASGGGSFSLQAPSSSSNNRVFTLPDSADATLLTSTSSVGKILQVVSTLKTNAFSSNSSTLHDITGMSVSITPSSSSSKVLINVALSYGGQNNMYAGINLLRGSTIVAQGDANVSNHRLCTFGIGGDNENFQYKIASATYTFLDSPSTTSATTYKLQGQAVGTDNPVQYYLVNSPYRGGYVNDNSSYVINTTSTITAMEVAA